MNDSTQPGIGEAWLALAADLRRELCEAAPDARVEAAVDPNGFLTLRVHTTPDQRSAAHALARRYEDRARTTCERCGGRISSVGAGPVVTILCSHCAGPARPARTASGDRSD
jgi:Zinc finger found in FPG and IleRS